MRTEPPLHSSEQVLLNSLTPEQMMAVAEWMGIETKLRAKEGYSQQVKDTLESMAERLRDLALQSKFFTKPSHKKEPKGYVVSYLEFL
ncbi:hypothetical protein QGP82_25640 [Leptothoe sp. LEGE 181152]|nr:hypothetical protein [Leptothoe sp. LEGE 181152]